MVIQAGLQCSKCTLTPPLPALLRWKKRRGCANSRGQLATTKIALRLSMGFGPIKWLIAAPPLSVRLLYTFRRRVQIPAKSEQMAHHLAFG